MLLRNGRNLYGYTGEEIKSRPCDNSAWYGRNIWMLPKMPDRLLYAISSRGVMNVSFFEDAFNALFPIKIEGQKEINYAALMLQTIRFLDALGHCEFDYEKRKIYICPPALVLLPTSGLPKAVLTGARSPGLLSRIKDVARQYQDSVAYNYVRQVNNYSLIPAAVYLEAIDKKHIVQVASAVGIKCETGEPAAWCIMNFSAGLDGVRGTIDYKERDDFNWPKRIFSLKNLAFDKFFTQNEGLRRVEYTNPKDQQKLHWLWDGSVACEVDRDWGRYLILGSNNVNVILYDEKRFLFAVPATVPLPRLTARALTLCTGFAPAEARLPGQPVRGIPADCSFYIYHAVMPPVAALAAQKLGQTPVKLNLEVDENGVIK
jgi:hypothetical protein